MARAKVTRHDSDGSSSESDVEVTPISKQQFDGRTTKAMELPPEKAGVAMPTSSAKQRAPQQQTARSPEWRDAIAGLGDKNSRDKRGH